MKTIYKFLLLSYFITTAVHAQDSLDCQYNLREALYFLKGNEFIKPDSIKAINYLKPCVKAENPIAQLLMARLYLNSNDKDNIKKGFKLTKKAAKQDFSLAAYDLGVLYKYGKGRNQNLIKAANWFRKGYKLGNSKAAYSLGYMFFKGFGNETQDYQKAVKWFRKSDYPMAKHWLAVCYYFGYGVGQDKSKALQLLKENPIDNSKILLNNLHNQLQENGLSQKEVNVLNQYYDLVNSTNETNIDISRLEGNWIGSFIQFDWSNSMIMQKLSTSISIKKDSITDEFLYESFVDDNNNSGVLINFNNSAQLDKLYLKIKHPYSSNATDNLKYEVIPSEIKLINYNNHEFMVFSTESFIDGWKEPGAPMLFLLQKERILTDNNVEISSEVINSLHAQENSFIKLFPNPFQNDLIIAYDLDVPLNVSVAINSIDGVKSYNVVTDSYQNAGEHRYYFDGSSLEKGVYVINIIYGNKRNTKMIVKN